MNLILFLILIGLLIYVCGKKTIKLIIQLALNFFLLIIMFSLISLGLNALVITILGLITITYITIYLLDGDSIKTKSSIRSVFLVILILSFFIYGVTYLTRIYGFGIDSWEEINMFSYNINCNMLDIEVSIILIGLIGAIIDSSISISSALQEIYENNKKLTWKELYQSGLNIGKDILGTTVNTLLFAFIGESLTLIFYLKTCQYSGLDLLNNKTLMEEIIKILFSAIGCLGVIPLTSFVSAKLLKEGSQYER
ncbi:MAG: YibE/F family protein [Bacilli bacterium]|nr:YibE/F family protein [Bacilli bacterium]